MLKNPMPKYYFLPWCCPVVFAILIYLSITACALQSNNQPFDPKRCMEQIPRDVDGLTIMTGPRTKLSIIRDMVPVVCNGQVLFNRMQSNDPELAAGSVVFRVAVEYTGEVISADVAETSIHSDHFLKKISDFIMDTDFISWTRDDVDTVFLYPVHFSE